MLVTVRLFPQIHGALIEELGKASRGLRAARAICLMTVGMTHERGHGGRVAPEGAARTPPDARPPSPQSFTAEDELFVSALLDAHDR
jgi:hypothetical protein